MVGSYSPLESNKFSGFIRLNYHTDSLWISSRVQFYYLNAQHRFSVGLCYHVVPDERSESSKIICTSYRPVRNEHAVGGVAATPHRHRKSRSSPDLTHCRPSSAVKTEPSSAPPDPMPLCAGPCSVQEHNQLLRYVFFIYWFFTFSLSFFARPINHPTPCSSFPNPSYCCLFFVVLFDA